MPKTVETTIQLSLLLLLGGFAAQHNRVLLNFDHCGVVFVATALSFLWPRFRPLSYFLIGFLSFTVAGIDIVNSKLDPKFAGDSLLTTVRVLDFPKSTDGNVVMLVEPVDDARLPIRSRIHWHTPQRIPGIGEIWQLELRLQRPRGRMNPGGFDVESWAFRERIFATGYVVPGKRNRQLENSRLSLLNRYRQSFVRHAERAPGDSAAVLAAISVGSRHKLQQQQWDAFAETGTSHLMAISGLHIGLAAAAALILITFVLGLLRVPGNGLVYATLGSSLVAALYAVIATFAVPSLRATLMLGFVGIAVLCRRRICPGRVVAVVAAMVFALDPIAIMAPGFLLSFGAVVVLLWLSRSHQTRHRGWRTAQLCRMQFFLLFGLMPATTLLFARVAWLAPAVNMIVVPVFSVVTVPITLLAMILHPISSTGRDFSLRLAGWSVAAIEATIDGFAALPWSSVAISGVSLSTTVILIAFLPLLWVVLPRGWPGRWIGVVGAISILLYKPLPTSRECLDAHFLDVGQGLSVVLESRNHTVVFDTGPSYRNGTSAASQTLIPFLKFHGVSKIDWLVVSHADNDHAGGVQALVENFKIERVVTGEPLTVPGVDSRRCHEGQHWTLDGLRFRVLHPGANTPLSGNDTSCVLLVEAGRHRLLLTGDIEAIAERQLLVNSSVGRVNVVSIPHHGSLTSSTPDLVSRLRADLAIASVGHKNRWGFPKPLIVRRWEDAGATVLDTANSGAVSLKICVRGGVSGLREERVERQRIWHDPVTL